MSLFRCLHRFTGFWACVHPFLLEWLDVLVLAHISRCRLPPRSSKNDCRRPRQNLRTTKLCEGKGHAKGKGGCLKLLGRWEGFREPLQTSNRRTGRTSKQVTRCSRRVVPGPAGYREAKKGCKKACTYCFRREGLHGSMGRCVGRHEPAARSSKLLLEKLLCDDTSWPIFPGKTEFVRPGKG